MANDDLIAGWQISVVMQRRTPLHWLQRHGEFHEGSDAPVETLPIRHAVWVPVLRTWRALGIVEDEAPTGTMASEVGQIPEDVGEFLPFLLEYRMIIEDEGAARTVGLRDLADRYPQYRGLLFPPLKQPHVGKEQPELSISILDYAPIPGALDQFHFNFEFQCNDCGGYLLDKPDVEAEPVRCKACGASFGSLASINDACRSVAIAELKARKFGKFRDPEN